MFNVLILSILLADTMDILVPVSHNAFSMVLLVCMFSEWYSQYVSIGTRSL